jgi:hypothetical protein
MTEKNVWNVIGIFLLLACLALILGIWKYTEEAMFEASLYFVVVVVLLSASLMALIANRWYPEKQRAFKVGVLTLYAFVFIAFVLIHIQFIGDPGLTTITGIIIGILIGLVAFVLILQRRPKQ